MNWINNVNKIREHPGISYSALKRLSISPKVFKANIQLEETESMALGSALETYLCFGEEEFNKYFTVLKTSAPTGQMLKFCKTLINLGEITERNFELAFESTESKIGSLASFKSKWEETETKAYTLECIEAKSKTAITSEMLNKILEVILKLKSNPFFEYIFKKPKYQVPMIRHDETYDLYLKGLIDIVVEHNGIAHIIDIKTTSTGTAGFLNTIYKYRYDLQAGFYTHLYNKPCVFQFLVLDVKYTDPPVIFEATPDFLKKAEEGFELTGGRKFKGWRQLLEELVEHKRIDQWDYAMDIYKSKGIVKI